MSVVQDEGLKWSHAEIALDIFGNVFIIIIIYFSINK